MKEPVFERTPADPEPNRGGRFIPQTRVIRLLIVLAGILVTQAIIYGPSLLAQKVLLPLDVLAEPGVYLPVGEFKNVHVPHALLSDLVMLFEPARRFAVAEIQSGRFPQWARYEYCGVPFIWPRFSPLLLLEMCVASPVVLAWTQVLAAFIAGTAAYLFFRRVLSLSFLPAAIGGWCYPLTAFFVFWTGFPTGLAVYWLPWILLAVYGTVRRPRSLAPLSVAVVTCVVLLSGHLDVAGQVLLVSGLFAAWCLLQEHGSAWLNRQALSAGGALVLAWLLGFLMACPYILPAVEYSKTGTRMEQRAAGEEERPPVGLAALPQVVLPDMYGHLVRVAPGNQAESSAAAYAGVVATLFAAPLALFSRRHRSASLLFCGLAIFSLSWCLNLPGFVQVLRLPLLNMMSHNRLVFGAAFAILSLAVIGLQALLDETVRWRSWFWAPAALLGVALVWCIYRSFILPEALEIGLASLVSEGKPFAGIDTLEKVAEAQTAFSVRCLVPAFWCCAALAGWYCLLQPRVKQAKLAWIAATALVIELVSFAFGRNAQTDPALYYPRIPALAQVAGLHPGCRVMGFGCLPANLAAACGLSDVRGYDGVDPALLTGMLNLGAVPDSPRSSYAPVQQIAASGRITPSGDLALSPVLDLLGVSYLVFRGSPFTNVHPAFVSNDYWVLRNPSALPRVFVPRRVEVIADAPARLAKLAAADFQPREVAFVESPVQLPETCQGSAQITDETPTLINVSVEMATPGVLVLADRWDPGWQASFNGAEVLILRVDHALRGVLLPKGTGHLQFRYKPRSFTEGLVLAGVAIVALLSWAAIIGRRRRPDAATATGS